MWKRISDWLHRVSSGWVALVALLVFLLFTALVLPRQAARSDLDTGDAGSPDTSFYYAPADLYRFAEAYGEGGRRAYVQARFTFDLVWPLVYGVFLATAISWVYGRGFTPGSRWQRANLMPVFGVLFDYLENVATSLVMLRYPAQTPVIDVLAPVLTMAKWVLIFASFALLMVGAIVAVWKWRKGPDQP